MWQRWLMVSSVVGTLLCPVRGAENAADLTLVYPCRQTPAPITIDGKLNPAEWGRAVEVGGFTISGSKGLAPEQVLMRLCYDQNYLYLAVTCLESNMKGLKTSAATVKDDPFWEDDSIEFFLDPNHDHSSYWQFAVTPKAVLYDNKQGASGWNADWKAAVTRDAESWTVEAAVPFADLGLKSPTPGTLWGFNLCRERRAGGGPELSAASLCNWANGYGTATLYGHLAFVAADWQASADTVAAVVKNAGGKGSLVFVPDGWWRSQADWPTPAHETYLATLRDEARGLAAAMAEIDAMYAAKPEAPVPAEHQELKKSYAKIKAVIEAGNPLTARSWAGYKRCMNTSQLLEQQQQMYWREKLDSLNRSMD